MNATERAGQPDPEAAGILDEETADPDPVRQFSRWLADARAAGLPEPEAMVLATVSGNGQPRARTVLLKSHDASGLVFYTNRTSIKARHLAAQPRACVLFPWHGIHRQVIIEGVVSAMTTQQSEPYFHSRPRGSQLGAWASEQSSVITSRAVLGERYALLERRWPPGVEVPMPDFWGGYRLAPQSFEFWQGRSNRLHDRLRYSPAPGGWTIQRLAP
ncbi:MAG TPA: pyridoxamine 5'-phosphate oxidase [Streptosporangiaceae bacterium]|nr:pyridoxamine 5'-phosphate oxidase [Streptosporangiaceae bacterium]